jgi:hypothetical protein
VLRIAAALVLGILEYHKMHVYLSSKIYSMKRLLLLTIPLLFNSAISYAQCTTPIFLDAILDQNICSGESVTLAASTGAIPLVITSVFDGPLTGGTPKGVELYVINDIADLSQYGIGSANNGGGTDGEEFTFPVASATAGDYIYLASEATQFNNWFGFNADYVTGVLSINGDDAIELFHLGNVIDVFGDINLPGTGEPWEYLDGWAYRNSSTGPDGNTFVLSSWSFSGPNALDGETLNSTAVSPVPIGIFTHAGNSTINTYLMDVTAASSIDYTFVGDFPGTDPAININLGDTLIFNVNSPGHPFWINTAQGTGTSNGVVVTNNGTSSGTITWVPAAAGTFYYNCQFHSGMTNTITVGPPVISYAWDNGVTNGVPFTPTSSGEYIVIATDGLGCTDTDTVNIIVNSLPTIAAGADQTICSGDTVTFLGSGGVSYAWNNGVSNGVPIPVTNTTTYTVTGTDANGCENTDEVIVSVNALPLVDAGADQAVCDGNSVTISGSGANSYTWDNSVSDGVAFTPTSTATYTVTGTDGNGCVNSAQVEVTVNALPTVSAGTDVAACTGDSAILNGSGAVSYTWDNGITDGVHFIPVCEGDQVTLSGTGVSSYTWDNGVSDGVVFSPLTTATYTVTGTDGNGCENSDQIDVIVNPLPIVGAGADQTVCEGDPVTVSGTGASSYTWDNGVVDGVAFSPLTTATYTVTGTDGNGCENSDQIDVIVNPLPIVGAGADQTVCEGDQVTLSGTGASSYTWDNGVMDGVVFNATVTTTYNVTGVDVNGCENTDALTIVVDECTGIFDVIKSNLTIFPNPTSDQITIDIKGYNGRVNAEVYDLQGRLLETTTNNIISLKKHAKGIYVLKVSYGEVTEEIRVVRD